MKVETYCCLALPVAGCWAPARSLCMQTVGSSLSGLAALISDESALEVSCAMHINNSTS